MKNLFYSLESVQYSRDKRRHVLISVCLLPCMLKVHWLSLVRYCTLLSNPQNLYIPNGFSWKPRLDSTRTITLQDALVGHHG